MQDIIDVIVLTDDEGNDFEFEKLDILDYKGETYILLAPMDDEDSLERECVIMRVEGDMDAEDGEFTLEGIEDEQLLETIFELFVENAEEE